MNDSKMIEKVIINSIYGDLEGDFYKGNSDKCIILCHGSCSNKDKEKNKLTSKELSEAGFNVLAFNFGGSGNSYDTEIDIDKQVEDLKSVVNFVKEKDFSEIGLIGDSLGGLIVLKTHSYISEDIRVLCLWAPVSKARTKQMFFEEYKCSEQQILEKGVYIQVKDGKEFRIPLKQIEDFEKFNQDEVFSKITCPVLIVHGTDDTTISLLDSEEARDKLKNAELKIIKGAPHNFKGYEKEISKITVDWFKKQL